MKISEGAIMTTPVTIEFIKTKVYTGVRKSNKTTIGIMAAGDLIMDGASYSAISGPWQKGVLPNGTYTVKKFNVVNKGLGVSFKSATGKQFFIPLQPPSSIKRSGFGIHQDGNLEGTQGCIGIVGTDADSFWKAWMKLSLKKRPDKLTVSGKTDAGTNTYTIDNKDSTGSNE
jgi:hypothetical protein